MPKYRITTPDGQKYEVTAPDGATQEQVLAYAQEHHSAPASGGFQNSVGRIPKPNPEAEGANPTEGMNWFQRGVAGVGKSIADTDRGMAQMGASVADYISPRAPTLGGLISGQGNSRAAEAQGAIDQSRREDAALMDTTSGHVGSVLGQIGQMAALPGGELAVAGRAAPYLLAAAKGAAFSGAQATGTGESRLGNAAMGGVAGGAGQGIAALGGVAAAAAKSRLNPVVQRSVELARAAGIPLHVSQVSNSRVVKTLGSMLNQLPFTGASRAAQVQQEAFNRAVARSFGSDATTLSDDAMKAASDKLGQQYDQIFAGKTVGLDQQALQALSALHHAAGNKLESQQADVARKQILRIIDEAGQGNSMTGQVYQSLRSALKKDFGGKDRLDNLVMDARRILDDSAKRSLGPDAAKLLDKTNGQWANFRTTKDALGQVAGAAGNVKPASLYPMIRKGSTAPMRELAQIGQNVLKDPIPDSGTAGRLLLAGGGLTVGGTAGMAGLAALAKPLAFAATAGRAMNSNALSKLTAPGQAINGLARLARGAPQGLPALANGMGAGTRFAQIFAAASADPQRGPEMIANLAPEEQQQAIVQFAQQNGADPQEVARRVQAETARLQGMR